MKSIHPSAVLATLAMLCALVNAPQFARAEAAGDELWSPGTNWLSLRAGYAKSKVENAGHGGGGYGFGFSRMLKPIKVFRWTLLNKFSLGGSLQHDLVSHSGRASEFEVPATLELIRHFDWDSPFHPYVGVGGGMYYLKTYRTGDDTRIVEPGGYVALGANVPIASRKILGLDVRLARVDANYIPPNPVFGLGSAEERFITLPPPLDVLGPIPFYVPHSATHWSVKINYTIAY